jgi:hypothetical protein
MPARFPTPNRTARAPRQPILVRVAVVKRLVSPRGGVGADRARRGAAVATYGTLLFPFGVVAAVAALWSNGVLANFRGDPQRAPDWAATLSMVAAAGSVILLFSGLIVRNV